MRRLELEHLRKYLESQALSWRARSAAWIEHDIFSINDGISYQLTPRNTSSQLFRMRLVSALMHYAIEGKLSAEVRS